jgi:hypothetical protein
MTIEAARMAAVEVLKVSHNTDEVKAVGANVQTDIDGAQEAARNPDGVKRLLLASSSLTVEYLTRSQGGNCERSSRDGNLLLIRPQITKSHVNVNAKEQRIGSSRATSLWNGRWSDPCCGSTGNVGSIYP